MNLIENDEAAALCFEIGFSVGESREIGRGLQIQRAHSLLTPRCRDCVGESRQACRCVCGRRANGRHDAVDDEREG